MDVGRQLRQSPSTGQLAMRRNPPTARQKRAILYFYFLVVVPKKTDRVRFELTGLLRVRQFSKLLP